VTKAIQEVKRALLFKRVWVFPHHRRALRRLLPEGLSPFFCPGQRCGAGL